MKEEGFCIEPVVVDVESISCPRMYLGFTWVLSTNILFCQRCDQYTEA
jgi:hypothetical protein